MAFLVSIFFIIVFWIVGYYPAGVLPVVLFNVGALQVSLAHIFLFLSIILLALSIKPPFRKVSFMLIAIWSIGSLGISFEQILPGMAIIGGVTLVNSAGNM